jgi:branched-chain amino acid transport system permease protein
MSGSRLSSPVAGFFYAHYILILSPVIMSFNEIGKIIIMVVFGGLGSFVGPLVGAPAIVIINEITRDFGAWNMVLYSLVVIIIMRFYRDGIVDLFRKIFLRFVAHQEKAEARLPSSGDI